MEAVRATKRTSAILDIAEAVVPFKYAIAQVGLITLNDGIPL
jgi:hypothetical protein